MYEFLVIRVKMVLKILLSLNTNVFPGLDGMPAIVAVRNLLPVLTRLMRKIVNALFFRTSSNSVLNNMRRIMHTALSDLLQQILDWGVKNLIPSNVRCFTRNQIVLTLPA